MPATVTVSNLNQISVRTALPALPYPPFPVRPTIKTPRLLIRSPVDDDLGSINLLRSQPEVMQWTSTGRIDLDLDKTLNHLDNWLSDASAHNFNCVICLASTQEVIGTGGSHVREGDLGWPEIGYMLRKEFWGVGYGTEFLKAFLGFWWTLPREECKLMVDKSTIKEEIREGVMIDEKVVAMTVEDNKASRNVLSKTGWDLVKVMEEEDTQSPEQTILLYYYVAQAQSDY